VAGEYEVSAMPIRLNVSRSQKFLLAIFTFLFFVLPGLGFVDKLVMFAKVVALPPEGRFEDGRFALVPLLNYLLVVGGMACLLLWAIGNGMFTDVEAPKYTMLENERKLDEADGVEWEHDAPTACTERRTS